MTALSYHYWTQPLPNRISWYMAQLPLTFQKMSTAAALGVELVIPFLIFAPRRLRVFGAWCLLGLQVLIFLTGNYTFFNLLAMALCVFLFDDRDFERVARSVHRLKPDASQGGVALGQLVAYFRVVAVLILAIGVSRMVETFLNVPVFIVKYTAPFEIVNSYGLFAVMTTERAEIIVEGSMDGENWRALLVSI